MNDDLSRLVRAVAQLEQHTGLRVAIIGGVARGVWASPRATVDVDVLLDSPIADPVLEHAAAVGLVADPGEVQSLASAGMTRLRLPDRRTGGVRLDVIIGDHPYYRRVLARSRLMDVLGHRVRVAAAEDVLLLKALADRPQDRADVHAIVEAQGDRLDRVLLRQEALDLEIVLPSELS